MAARIDFKELHDLAIDDSDHALLDRIEADREALLAGGTVGRTESFDWLSLDLSRLPGARSLGLHGNGRVTLALRRELAPASVDTFLEIFRDHAHTRFPGFRGESGGTVLDLGANEGYYTLLMKLLNPALRIVAVEPVEENVALLEANLRANGIEGVEVEAVAVTGLSGTVELETLENVGTVASTDIQSFPRPWIREEKIHRRTVTAVTLEQLVSSRLIETAETVKIDVEGSEFDILSHTPSLLGRFRSIVVECHGGERRSRCAGVLESEGFRCVYAEKNRSGDLYYRR